MRRLLRALVGPNWELVNRRLAGFLPVSPLEDEPGSRIGGQAAHQSRGAADCGEYREATGGVAEDLAVARAKRARLSDSQRNFVLPQEFAPGDGVCVGVAAVLQPRKTLGE